MRRSIITYISIYLTLSYKCIIRRRSYYYFCLFKKLKSILRKQRFIYIPVLSCEIYLLKNIFANIYKTVCYGTINKKLVCI